MVHLLFASDHAGAVLKATLLNHVKDQVKEDFIINDLGVAVGASSVDYPDYADHLAAEMLNHKQDTCFGVLVCGSGIGMSMAANRHRHIRAALCHNPVEANLARQHNNANVIVFGERLIGSALAIASLDAFLAEPFEGGRHANRIDKFS